MHKIKRALFGVGMALAVILGGFGLAGHAVQAAQAAHTGQVMCNSGASDDYVVLTQDSRSVADLLPGQCYTLKAADVSGFRVTVYGLSFRVRYNATSGAYQACQSIAEGAKTFGPSNTPDRIYFLSYGGPNCQHDPGAVPAYGASGQVGTAALDGRAGRAGRAVVQPAAYDGRAVAQRATAGTVCAGTSGLKYDADYSNGYSWVSVAKGSCKTDQPRDKWKAATGDRSMAVVGSTSAGPGATCVNDTIIQVANPGSGVRVNVASYDLTGCRN